MNAKNLELNEVEKENAQNFLNKLPKRLKYSDVELIFSNGAGIGIGITIKVGDKSKDITDYTSW